MGGAELFKQNTAQGGGRLLVLTYSRKRKSEQQEENQLFHETSQGIDAREIACPS
jgi:hypothetical protein